MNKSEAAAIYRASGSVAFVALARTAHVVAPDRHDPTRRIFASLKNNLSQHAESLAFRVDADGRGAKLKWENQPVRVNIAELLAVDAPRQRRPTNLKSERAVELLDEMLRSGAPVPVEEIRARAEAEGIGYRTLQRAYHDLGGRDAERHGFGGKPVWSLPISTTTDDQNVQPLGRE